MITSFVLGTVLSALLNVKSFNPHSNPVWWNYTFCFIAEETEIQRGQVICLRSHSSQVSNENPGF